MPILKKIVLALAFAASSVSAQVCTDNLGEGTAPDQGCNNNNPVCVSFQGYAIGHMAPGQQCVPCVRSNVFEGGEPDCGCPASRPLCMLSDGTSRAVYNTAGTQCVGDGTNVPPAGDLNIRFNKFANLDGSSFRTLGMEDYPIEGATGVTMKTTTNAISVVTPDDYELKGAQASRYIEAIEGPPSMPNGDSTNPYWAELAEVTRVQILRRQSADPHDLFGMPDLWSNKDIHDVAKAVHDEYPGHHQVTLIEWLWSQGVKLDFNIMPKRCEFDFIGMQIRLADLNTWATRVVSPINFNVKWTAGRPRPEEVAYMIATDELTEADGVPSQLIADIKSMGLTSAPSFTAYPEGCPRHPSWPAMHSAASSASLWLSVVLDLTPEQRCEALRLDHAVSYARTVAGVHYESDNVDGLNLGSMILSEKLADHLAEEYGADRAAVQAKIEQMRIDWRTFDSETCTWGQ